jgi:hypothetical protein
MKVYEKYIVWADIHCAVEPGVLVSLVLSLSLILV